MDDTGLDLNLETLRDFVSPAIFEFLSSADASTVGKTMNTKNSDLTLDDHNLAGNDPPPTLDELDAHVDALLLECSRRYEEEELEPSAPKRARVDSTLKESSIKRVFGAQKTEQAIAKAKLSAVPGATLTDTNYCVRIWKEWCDHRCSVYGDSIPCLEELPVPQLASYLSNFVFEVRKKTGEEFPPKSLYHIICGIQRYIRMSGRSSIDVFKDSEFADFQVCLDAEMKRLQREGHGSKTRKAEPLTLEEEEVLWEKGLLGKSNPQALVDTILVMNGIYFALRSGQEHRQLRSYPCQITLHERPGARPYLEYVEDTSKNRSGGLKGRKVQPKVVQHHNNPSSPERCFVELFRLYQSLCPPDRPKDAFYFKPLAKPTPTCWYSCKPIGHNKLEGTVARLCKEAGIPGFRTNHSLRATAATRLYNAGVDEQQVMERTGHRSLDRVRSYKHTSMQQKEALSDLLYSQRKDNATSSGVLQIAHPHIATGITQPSGPESCLPLPSSQCPVQVNSTDTSQSVSMTCTSSSNFNFQNCSVTINVNK